MPTKRPQVKLSTRKAWEMANALANMDTRPDEGGWILDECLGMEGGGCVCGHIAASLALDGIDSAELDA